MPNKVIDLTGQKFGRLTVIERAENNKYGHIMWLCKCDCGNEKIIYMSSLRSGRQISCGCYCVERTIERSTKHGKYYTAEYRIRQAMIQRCTNPNMIYYKYYGGRGIKVCERWLHSFENFYTDMGPRPGKEYSIDRINNDGNYEPSNCRWATKKEQITNRRNSKK